MTNYDFTEVEGGSTEYRSSLEGYTHVRKPLDIRYLGSKVYFVIDKDTIWTIDTVNDVIVTPSGTYGSGETPITGQVLARQLNILFPDASPRFVNLRGEPTDNTSLGEALAAAAEYHNDNTTIGGENTFANPNRVIRVPNALTIGTEFSAEGATTFDGSLARILALQTIPSAILQALGIARRIMSTATPVPHTGSTNKTLLFQGTIPGAIIGVNGQFDVMSTWKVTSSTSPKTFQVEFNDLVVFQVGTGTGTNAIWGKYLTTLWNKGNGTLECDGGATSGTNTGVAQSTSGTSHTLHAINAANDITVKVYGTLTTGTETIAIEHFRVMATG